MVFKVGNDSEQRGVATGILTSTGRGPSQRRTFLSVTEPNKAPVSSATCKQKRNITAYVYVSDTLLRFPGRGGGLAYSILDKYCIIASEYYDYSTSSWTIREGTDIYYLLAHL